MSIDKNLFGRCSKFDSRKNAFSFDFSSLINKLLLFDQFVLYSPNLKEIPYLVDDLGFEATLCLLSSGALKIACEMRITAQVAQTQSISSSGRAYPKGFYEIQHAFVGKEKNWISEQLKNIGTSELSNKQIKKLKLAVIEALDKNYLQDNRHLLHQTNEDLASNRSINIATLKVLEREKNIRLKPEDFFIKLHQVDTSVFEVETNLEKIFSWEELELHKIVEKILLGVGNFNLRMAEMKLHNALSGFIDDEIDFVRDRLDSLLIEKFNPYQLEESFHRVLRLKKHPIIVSDSNPRIDIEKLFKVRQSDELKIFKDWLKDTEEKDDADILKELNNIRGKLGLSINSNPGKFIKLLVSTFSGLVPGAGISSSLSLGVIDTFLLDQLLPKSSIITFIDKLYPSIFTQN